LNWRLKLSNWLSGGAIAKYRQQAETAKAQWQQLELDLENIKAQLKQSQIELEQTKAQLQIAKGFQVELGQTQLQLQQTAVELKHCQEKLQQKQQEVERSQTQLEQAQKELAESQDWLQQLQTKIQVVEVERIPIKDFEALWGFDIGTPSPQTEVTAGLLVIKGWVLGKRAEAKIIKIIWQQQTLMETTVEQPRKFVQQQYPEIPAADSCGFETAFSVAGMPANTELEIQAVLADESLISLSRICLKR
jgi:DNA repair exonuclease SbcCD ATPase subunit